MKPQNYKIKKRPEWIRENVKLAEYTTFKIGGPAKYFCIVKNKEDLVKAVAFAKKRDLPFFILGGGSNLLVSDKGYNGLVVKMQNAEYKIQDAKISADAGVSLGQLVSAASKIGLSGLEWAAGIPGAVGGAIRGNAGAFGGEIKDAIQKVEAFDAQNLKYKIYNLKECEFGYRDSIFKKKSNLIILSCELRLKKENKEKIKEKIKEYLNYRRIRHPKEPSAGSVFKNTESAPAALLIHRCGLTGKRLGCAQISDKHSNFIINLGGARAEDILGLINLAKKEVKNKLGIEIEEEIQLLGDF